MAGAYVLLWQYSLPIMCIAMAGVAKLSRAYDLSLKGAGAQAALLWHRGAGARL